MIETETVCHDCQEIKATLDILLTEVRALRRERLPADPERIEDLLRAIFAFFPGTPFTAAFLLEYAAEDDPDSLALHDAITACIGPKPKVSRLSRFLGKCVGTYGIFRFRLYDPHSRDGKTFHVTNVSNSVTTDTFG